MGIDSRINSLDFLGASCCCRYNLRRHRLLITLACRIGKFISKNQLPLRSIRIPDR
jgi:hypothetical protein